MSFVRSLRVAKELFVTDMKLFLQMFIDNSINMFVWMFSILGVNAYLLPKFGISETFGLISLCGFFAVAGIYQGFSETLNFVADLETSKIVSYYATLPLPAWLMLVRKMVSSACSFMIYTMILIPFGKLLVWNLFDLGSVNWIKFAIMVVLSSSFYGAFTLFAVIFIKSMRYIGRLWTRLVFPLWFLGGFSFTWRALHQASPVLAYIDLLNPVVYITEGYRSAVIGPDDYMNFGLCCAMIIGFTMLVGWRAIVALKKRLDFV